MKKIILITLVLICNSCFIVKINLFKRIYNKPKVESPQNIQSFLDFHKFESSYTFIPKGDTAIAKKMLYTFPKPYFLFDNTGNSLCYKGDASCAGTQVRTFIKGNTLDFGSCEKNYPNIENILRDKFDLNGNKADFSKIEKADYYIVGYWKKCWGGKKGYEENITWIEDEIKKSNKKIIFLKINLDLQANWGLEEGEEVSRKIKIKNGEYFVEYGKLPYKK